LNRPLFPRLAASAVGLLTAAGRLVEARRLGLETLEADLDPGVEATVLLGLAEAHKHASQHRVEIEASTRCGCFFCFRTFPPLLIKAWIDAKQTALCPGCGVDSVLGDASLHRIDDAFLRRMYDQFFARRSK